MSDDGRDAYKVIIQQLVRINDGKMLDYEAYLEVTKSPFVNGLQQIKTYLVAPNGKHPTTVEDLVQVINQSNAIYGEGHGVAILTPSWINLNLYSDKHMPILPRKFLFEEIRTRGNASFKRIEQMVDGPSCIYEDVIFGDEAQIRLRFLRGEIDEAQYLTTFSDRVEI